MNPTLTLGRIAGIRVGVNWSWLIVFALIAWSLASAVFPSQNPHLGDVTYAAMGVVAAILFFGSLLLHELGHALQARREHVEIDGITLWLFGGVAQIKGGFPSAGAELRIALAGPLVSLVLGGLFVAAAVSGALGTAVGGVAAWLGYINLILLVFNMLPALPLDGGRVFRAVVWQRSGDFARATAVAARVGRGFGYAMIGLGMLLFMTQSSWGGAWIAFVGWFLLQAAAAEGRYGLLRDALGNLRVRELMVRAPVTAAADASLARFMDGVAHAHRYTTYPVVEDGEIVGLLSFAAVARVPRSDWETTRVRDCMLGTAEVPHVREDELLIDAIADLAAGRLDRALVLEDGHVVGLLSITDVGRLVAAAGSSRRRDVHAGTRR